MAERMSRRGFLVGGASVAGAAGAVGALAACSPSDGSEEGGGSEIPPPQYVAFHGQHQTGITSPAPAAGLAASLRVVNADRDDLVEAMQELTAEA
ncbi:hypothetical protein B7486_71565, partial [cyanobacterium TDX16]